MVNIFDVARQAGVSKSTVSRVFSGNGYVSNISRRKVLDAADQLGYVPSILARQLEKQSTKTIGFIAKSYYPEVGKLLELVTKYAKAIGFKVSVYFTDSKADELLILNEFKLHALDAIFFVANRNTWQEINKYTKYGPIVTWRRVNQCNVYSSYIDHYPLYLEILNYITNKYGPITIGHILNNPDKGNTKARIKAIEKFKEKNPNCDKWHVFYPEQTGAGERAAKKFIELKNKPKAVIAYSDYVAAGFLSALQKLNWTVPEDVKLFGFDNSDFGKYLNISTIDPKLSLQIKNDINKIFAELNNSNFTPIIIKPRIFIRKTC